MTENSLYWLWLCEKVRTPSYITKLLDRFGSIEKIYNSTADDLKGILRADIVRLLSDKSLDNAERIKRDTARAGAFIVTYDSPEYPELLKHIYDPPYVLYMKGTLFDWNSFIGIGVVGTRKCNENGIKTTDILVRELAKNDFMIVSGLARGIDSAAAKAAFAEGKPSIGVLGCGIDMVYPPENIDLFENVENTGLIISEYPPGAGIPWGSFPKRNRIISGLSRGVLVTQAPKHSGALITARFAGEQGRDVFATPGYITDKLCYGSNKLIADGAIPVIDAYDIIKEYPEIADKKPEVVRYYKKREQNIPAQSLKDAVIDMTGLTHIQQGILKCIDSGKNHIDEIIKELNVSSSLIANELLIMEILGLIKTKPGNRYELKGKI